MIKLTVVIPTYNRANNLRMALTGLEFQNFKDFEVIIVDDGSEDHTYDVFKEFTNKLEIKHVKIDANAGYAQGRARNIGAQMASIDSVAYFFLDSDVILPADALERFMGMYQTNSNRVCLGMYHWGEAQEITRNDIKNRFDMVLANALPLKKVKGQHGMTGRDIRWNSFVEREPDDVECTKGAGLACFGGCILIPKNIFKKTGGYDEYIRAPVEDGDFGLTLWQAGVDFSFNKYIIAHHVWHPRNIPVIQDVSAKWVKYLDKKHEVDVSWTFENMAALFPNDKP